MHHLTRRQADAYWNEMVRRSQERVTAWAAAEDAARRALTAVRTAGLRLRALGDGTFALVTNGVPPPAGLVEALRESRDTLRRLLEREDDPLGGHDLLMTSESEKSPKIIKQSA